MKLKKKKNKFFLIINFILIWYMAQFIIGFAAGVYIGTYYNCRPGLKVASETFEQYCPKRIHPENHYEAISGNDEKNNTEIKPIDTEKKDIQKSIELTSNFKKWF